MITLATLAEATAQEVFDQVAKHLLTQNVKSRYMNASNRWLCGYRGANNTKCAAGCLISDEEYDKEDMEGVTWRELLCQEDISDNHENLISDLQFTHDEAEEEDWPDRLCSLAKDYKLQFKLEEYRA